MDRGDDDGTRAALRCRTPGVHCPVAMLSLLTLVALIVPWSCGYLVAEASASTSGVVVEETLSPRAVTAASTIRATSIQRVDTSRFSPPSPDPSGVTWLPDVRRLLIVDSEVDETTGAGHTTTNMWRLRTSGSVDQTGSTLAYTREPTGVTHAVDDRLFISADDDGGIHEVRTGGDGRFGTVDDPQRFIDLASHGVTDEEDPAFDPETGDLFFLNGSSGEVWRMDPVDGVFGNTDDRFSRFDVGPYGVRDAEALAYDPDTDNLLVGDRTSARLYEVTRSGSLVDVIDVSAAPGLRYVSGITVAPSSSGSGNSLWIVDRGEDNNVDPTENDGKLFELTRDVPTVTTNTGIALREGHTATLSPSHLETTHAGAGPSGLTYRVDAAPDHGRLERDGRLLSTGGTFTQADIDAGRIAYTHDGSETTSDRLDLTVTDEVGNAVSDRFLITVRPVDDPPSVTTNTGLRIAEGTSAPVTRAHLASSDPDTPPGHVTYTLVRSPDHGQVTVGGARRSTGGTFSQADIDAGRVAYAHDGSGTTQDAVGLTIGDASTTLPGHTFAVSVVPVDDRPVAHDDTYDVPVAGSLEIGPTAGVLANDQSADGEALTVRLVDPPDLGNVRLGSDGSFTYVHSGDAATTDAFTYQVLEGARTSDLATVTLRIGDDAVFRLAGATRIETALAISRSSYPDLGGGPTDPAGAPARTADAVVLARADDFADGLTGTPLAARVNGPLLLTFPDTLHAGTAAEIRRVLAPGGTVHLLGGTAALSSDVEVAIEGLGYRVLRASGADRYATAAAVAARLGDVATVLLARGDAFPDALAAGPAAIASDGAILLTDGDRPTGPADAFLAAHRTVRSVAVGGPAARAYPTATPLSGATRHETAVLVADAFFDGPSTVGIARSDDFVDALAGGVHVGRTGGPVLLTPSEALDGAVATWLEREAATVRSAFVYGGVTAVGTAVEVSVGSLIG